MKVIMKVQLCNHLGVFNPGDEYEADEKQCKALIAEDYAFQQAQLEIGPAMENAMKEPAREKAINKSYQDKAWLKRHYKTKTMLQIADECGVGAGTISAWVKKFGLK